MKSKLLIGICALGLLVVLSAAEKPSPTGVIVIGHDTVNAAFAKGGPLLVTNSFKVQAGRRTEPGEAEIHQHDTDVFYILEGSAIFVTGGEAIESREISPGETRAKAIKGGEERRLSKGDVIIIPTGVPHWFKEVKGPFLYYVVKVTQDH